MTRSAVIRSLAEMARGLERAERTTATGWAPVMGQRDDPEGTLQVRISDTLARRMARKLRDIAEAIEERA